MRHLLIRVLTISVFISACASPATTEEVPASSSVPATAAPTATQEPTPTPEPCGRIVSPMSLTPASIDAQKFEPPDGYTYFGFFYDETEASSEIMGDTRPLGESLCDAVQQELAGKSPTIMRAYSLMFQKGSQTFAEAIAMIDMYEAGLRANVVPFIDWGPASGYNGTTTKDIVSGKLDDYIRQYARDVKAYGDPVFIRLICGEFNNSSWTACAPLANPALTIDDFVNSWKRIVDIFNKEGVTNVAWVWIMLPIPPEWGSDPRWREYYPGDEYVDWVGVNMGDWGQPNWMDPAYEFALKHDKPFFISEFAIRFPGVPTTHADQLDWIGRMFDYVESHDQVKAILYFNMNLSEEEPVDPTTFTFEYNGQVNYLANVNDFDQRLIAGGPDMRALFSSRIANDRYISTVFAP